MSALDLLITGARVVDPATGHDGIADLGVAGGTIAEVAQELPAGRARRVIDGTGRWLLPGLVDSHVHMVDLTRPHANTAAHRRLALAGVTTAVDHLATLDAGATGTRRERLMTSLRAAEDHEMALFGVLLAGLTALPKVTLYGKAARRTATAYFTVAGHTPEQVARYLAGRRVNVWHGHNYAWELTGVLGIRDRGGAVRAGLVHYNDREDVDRLLAGVAGLG
jgi:dihydroorotase-like cyclic amidohydrolase